MTVQTTLKKALELKGKITRIKKEILDSLDGELRAVSIKLLRQLEDAGEVEVSNELGKALIVERRGVKRYDTKKLIKDLGVTDLKKYEIEGKGSKFLKITETKDDN